MRRLIWMLIVLLLSVWIGLKIANDPGYAIFAYQNWTMEMPLWFAIVSTLVFLLLFAFLVRSLDKIDFSLYRYKHWLSARRKYKAYSRTNKGLLELIEGQWQSAEYDLSESVPESSAPLINYLAAAKAAHEQRAYDRRDLFLRKAHQLAPQAEVAIGLTQAQLQVEQGQFEQAAATLEHLQRLSPKHPYVLKLLEKVYVRLSAWGSLIKILPQLRKAKVLTQEQFLLFEENVYKEILQTAINKKQGPEAIQKVWASLPKGIRKKPLLVYTYSKAMLVYPNYGDEIAVLIQSVLKKQWNSDLVYVYGLLKTSSIQKQIKVAEEWLRYHGNQSTLLLTLGRLYERADIWGKAREFFEESLKLHPNPETYMEYGRLLTELGEFNPAAESYKKGLELVERNSLQSQVAAAHE